MGISRKTIKITIIVILMLVILVLGGFWLYNRSQPAEISPTNTNATDSSGVESNVDKDRLRIIVTGDVIAHDSVNANAKAGDSYDYYRLMSEMQPYFDKSDVRFCNQATPAGGEKFGISGYPVFNAPLELTEDMAKLGCNVVNLGTNHTYDKGQPLINEMVKKWDQQQVLAHAGANRTTQERDEIKYFEVQGVKFAFLSYSTYTNSPISNGFGVTMYSPSLAQRQIDQAKNQADIVMVSMRWGTEYSPDVNASQTQISQYLADQGADLVIGHGPHVLQPVKKLSGAGGKDTYVWYSVGNFLNTQLDVESLTGVIGIMDIDVPSKKLNNISALPIYNHYDWTLEDRMKENLLARKNLKMYPLDTSGALIGQSQLGTSVAEQTDRIRAVLNKFIDVKIIKSSEF